MYPVEVLGEDDDDGTMPDSLEALRQAVVGHRIVSVEEGVEVPGRWYGTDVATVITLDTGQRVRLVGNSDCCAYTELEAFLLHPEAVEHMILGVSSSTSPKSAKIWSCGNPFYYAYGFTITVDDT